MLRVTKLCDYAIVLLTHLAQAGRDGSVAARDLADRSEVPLPTVSKILKQLGHEGLVVSQRGAKGGYRLARPATEVSVADIIAAVEGPIAMTDCSLEGGGLCDVEDNCRVRANWRLISSVVEDALSRITLADMAGPLPPQLVRLGKAPRQAASGT